ncbi:NAD-dependent epimerase [Foetidibacter luteolus]|uniref:NAD-dependent epimerase n=1 Tax=Foetidibacter luteolus TaxID=2608880 RepID=UPI00129B0B7C|nr:NAD-dependent epimerase [Foetidibacter luteolus]
MNVLVTGAAGFIGFHTVNRLLQDGHKVVGIDNLNNYYDVQLKCDRLNNQGIMPRKLVQNAKITSETNKNYTFQQLHIADKNQLQKLFADEKFDYVVHLAAQAGVRYSLINPDAYIESNIISFVNILECCRQHSIQHLVYASSSSVYGLNEQYPFKTTDNTDHSISLYGATKKSNELMAHTYSHLFNLPTTGLRFFTAYGPWGRPDMALFLFTQAIIEGKPIQLYNHGKMLRDFTYVDDIVEGVVRVLSHIPQQNPAWKTEGLDISASSAPYKIYNIGNNAPVNLLDFVLAIEKELNLTAIKEMLPLQAGDVPETYADISDLVNDIGYKPSTSIQYGVKQFVNWYKTYYHIH